MRRKRLNHYANVVCNMFVGWRMGDDLEVLSELPDGKITVNLLTGNAYHFEVGEIDLWIPKELQAWLQDQSKKEGVDIGGIESAILEVDIDKNKVATNKKKVVMFHFDCNSLFTTSEACYSGALKEVHKWHSRIAI